MNIAAVASAVGVGAAGIDIAGCMAVRARLPYHSYSDFHSLSWADLAVS